MNARKRAERLLFATLLLATWGASASAYVDPGTGSLFTQVLVAGALGGAFAMKNLWSRVWKSLTRRAVQVEVPADARDGE